jgi:hypothetical protein
MTPPDIFSQSERSCLTMLISKSAFEGCQEWHLKSIISKLLEPYRNDQARDRVGALLGLFGMLPRYDRRPEKQYLYLKVNHVLMHLHSTFSKPYQHRHPFRNLLFDASSSNLMGQRLVSSSTDNNIFELNGRNQSSSSNSYENLGSILCGVMCGSRIQLWEGQTYANKRPS